MRVSRRTNGSSPGDASSLTETHYVLRPTRVPSLQMETTKRMTFVNAIGKAKRFRFCGGEYGGWGPDVRLSSVREGVKDEDAHREDHGCLGSWLVVSGRGLEWEVLCRCSYWMALGHFSRYGNITVWTWSPREQPHSFLIKISTPPEKHKSVASLHT